MQQLVDIDKVYREIEDLLNLVYSRQEISGMLLYQLAFDYCNASPESIPSSGEQLLLKIVNYLTNHCRKVFQVCLILKANIERKFDC